MTVATTAVLDRLERVRSTGADQFEAACPAHQDRVASLSVGFNDRGDVLIHCQAGCSVDEVRVAMGAEWGELFADASDGRLRLRDVQPRPVPVSANGNGSRRRDIEPTGALPPRPVLEHWASRRAMVAERLYELRGWSKGTLERFEVGCDGERATWPVYDAQGRLTNVCRYRPGGSPKMVMLQGRPRELFPAPETFTDVDVLWLVEGEPDAMSMFELGIPAVGVPGVGTWQQGWAQRFRGRFVVVCFDCDEQGRRAAQERAAVLIANGVHAWPVDLDPSRSDGFDISDALLIATREERRGDLLAFFDRLQTEAMA